MHICGDLLISLMRYLFLLFITFSICTVKAQLVKNEQKIGWKNGVKVELFPDFKVGINDIKLKSFPNKDKSLNCVVITKRDSIIANVYNSKLEVLYTFKTINLTFEEPLNFFPIGGFFKDDSLTIILKSNPSTLENIVCNLKTLEIKRYSSTIENKDKRYATTINAGDICYQVYVGNKSPLISILSNDDRNGYKESTFNLNKDLNTYISDKELLKALTPKARMENIQKLTFIDKQLITNADDAVSKNKMYLSNDTLTLTIDNVYLDTKIFTLNLSNNNLSYKSISHEVERDSVGEIITVVDSSVDLMEKSYNSIIIDNILYHLFVSPILLKLSATNLINEQLLFVNKTFVPQDINYKNTKIIQEGTSASSTETKELNTEQLLRKILRGSAVLSGTRNNSSQHQLTIGGYKHLESNSGAGGFGGFGGVGGMMLGTTFGLSLNRNWDMVTRFKTLFDPITSKHIPGEITETGSDLIDDYVKDVKMPSQGSDTFYSDGNTYYTYYDNDLKSLITIQLK